MEVGLLNGVQTKYRVDSNNRRQKYLDLKFFSSLVFQREIFIINIFGEVRIGN
jgi:hypothetical protein